ncbi:beta-galactosidase-1-like protein 2 [Lepus europaeus]|uniref:beta-galactosidase-1-like protein 2 n=1 Tax=Lepus europaeus TaxID=9983 RepID=UPI002B476BFA|nr:beta-galactosidase-1-like protein 2 [Lepus europaeus]
MWASLGRLEGILYLSSALSVMVQINPGLPLRINQTHLLPSSLKNRRVGLKVEGSNFTLEGFPFLILAGTMHYFRVPRKYWRDRLKKLKACGFNTLTTHVPWNLHEPIKGQYVFTGNLDFEAFISIASQLDLWVIICPGPYIGSDLDLGGLPSWLLRDPKMKLRTTYQGFTKAMNRYFDQLIPRIEKLQYHHKGSIIAVQVENEYGAYNLDKKYMPYVKNALVKRKIQVMLMTADNGLELTKGHLEHELVTVHMRNIQRATYQDLISMQGPSPILMTVYTASSVDTWGDIRQTANPQVLMKDVREMFNLKFSLNFYMFHGGTNFGFMGGAKILDNYCPAVTSYDYGALLRDDGEYTPEYTVYKEFFSSVIVFPNAPEPERIRKMVYKSVKTLYFMTLWEILPYLDQPIKSIKPVSMENLPVNQDSGQAFGYTLYETTIFSGHVLYSRGHVQDRGQVFLNERSIGVLDHLTDQLPITRQDYQDSHLLRILVENQGRLASGKNINTERKGLTGDIYLDNSPLRKFTIYNLEMRSRLLQRKLPSLWKPATKEVKGPAFFLGMLRVGDNPKDTFIKLEGWNKGVVFINGQNLGRYWDLGPQETLYLPGPWLRPGKNEIIVFEESEPGMQIQFERAPQLGY